ncbi:hypothetical protein PHISP_01205 [Aspergillus sp. HF37]|nr:hypothetical protein PHISP_01205 [Aspergillus sp. HF37]
MSSKPPLRQNLWALALKALSSEDKDRLQKYHAEKEKDAASIDGALREVRGKQQKCLQKRWTVKTKTGRIIVRDVLDKIALWANKFKEVGDAAVQFDTSHASLPWAGVRHLHLSQKG